MIDYFMGIEHDNYLNCWEKKVYSMELNWTLNEKLNTICILIKTKKKELYIHKYSKLTGFDGESLGFFF